MDDFIANRTGINTVVHWLSLSHIGAIVLQIMHSCHTQVDVIILLNMQHMSETI